jgi:hypothetical protein
MRTWEPKDFILEGRYCDTETIEQLLDKVQEQAGAAAVVLLVFRRKADAGQITERIDFREFFRSLFLTSSTKPESLGERIRDIPLHNFMDAPGRRWLHVPKRSFPETCLLQDVFTIYDGDEVVAGSSLAINDRLEPFHGLISIVGDSTKVQVVYDPGWLLDRMPTHCPSASQRSRLANLGIQGQAGPVPPDLAVPILLIVDPHLPSDDSDRIVVDSTLNKLTDELFTCVNASAGIFTRRIRDTDEDVDQVASQTQPDFLSGGGLESYISTIADKLVQRAVGITHSTDGAIYLATDSSSSLTRVATFSTTRQVDEGVYPQTIPISPDPMQHNPGRHHIVADVWKEDTFQGRIANDAGEFHRLSLTRHGSSCQMAVQIMQRNFGEKYFGIEQHEEGNGTHICKKDRAPTRSLFGVVTVRRAATARGKAADPYSHHDFAALQHVARRFCLWRTRAHSFFLQDTISRIVRDSSNPTAIIQQSRPHWADEFPEGFKECWQYIPAEAKKVVGHVEHILKQACYLTRSFSGTIRLLSPCHTKLPRYSLYLGTGISMPLQGHLSSPAGKPTPNPWVFSLDEGGDAPRGVMECLAEGQCIDCYDIREDRDTAAALLVHHLLEMSPHVKSMIVFPIQLGQRAVGTMFLASNHVDAYGEAHFLLSVLSSLVGLALQLARQSDSTRLFGLTADAKRWTHKRKHCIDELKKIAAALRRRLTKKDVRDKSTELLQQARDLQPPDSLSQDRFGSERSVISILRTLDRDLAGSEYTADRWNAFEFPRGEPPAHYVLPLPDANYFLYAAWQIILNSAEHASLPIIVTVDSIRHGGGHMLRIRFTSSGSAGEEDPFVDRQLFRVLHPDDAPTSALGTFICGTMIHWIGGDVFVENPGERPMTVTVHLPLYEEWAS